MTIHFGSDDGGPPTGIVIGDDAAAVPFAGWLELMHAISRLASARPPDSALVDVGQPLMDLAQEALP